MGYEHITVLAFCQLNKYFLVIPYIAPTDSGVAMTPQMGVFARSPAMNLDAARWLDSSPLVPRIFHLDRAISGIGEIVKTHNLKF